VITDGNVNPTVETHADAIGRVISAAPLDHIAGQSGNEDLRPFRAALAPVVVNAQVGRMQNPESAVLVDQAARVIHLREGGHLIALAIAAPVNAAKHLASAGSPAD